MDLARLAKALDALFLDMETMPALGEAEEAWVATRERVHWLAECATALAAAMTDSVDPEFRREIEERAAKVGEQFTFGPVDNAEANELLQHFRRRDIEGDDLRAFLAKLLCVPVERIWRAEWTTEGVSLQWASEELVTIEVKKAVVRDP